MLREDATWPSAAESAGDSDCLRLIDRRRIRTRRPGWEVFKLRNVIQQWVNDPSSNRGDQFITSPPLYGCEVLRSPCMYVCFVCPLACLTRQHALVFPPTENWRTTQLAPARTAPEKNAALFMVALCNRVDHYIFAL